MAGNTCKAFPWDEGTPVSPDALEHLRRTSRLGFIKLLIFLLLVQIGTNKPMAVSNLDFFV